MVGEPHCNLHGTYPLGGRLPLPDLLDDHHLFEKGRMVNVCGNTYDMLAKTRFAPYFDFYGDRSTHYGIFPDCGKDIPYSRTSISSTTSGGQVQSSGGCC